MTRPTTYLLRMVLFLAAVALVAVLLFPALRAAFVNNVVLNSLILAVLALGIAWNLRLVQRLAPEARWVTVFRQERTRLTAASSSRLPAPRLLAPMAAMLTARAAGRGADEPARISLSAPAMRSLLDSLASRLDESRELSRYMTSLLIFLGLLGTFWGLLITISSVSDVIGGLTVGTGDINVLFDQLKAGLARPLHGMGTAFSSSMLGLAGALVLGFLDLTAGQAQNRFFNELEEWLAGLTRLSSGVLGADGEGSAPAYVQALLEQTAENMEGLQHALTRGEEARLHSDHAMQILAERLEMLAAALRDNQQVLQGLMETQAQIAPTLGHLLTEAEQARGQTTAELRLLTRTLAHSTGASLAGTPGAA